MCPSGGEPTLPIQMRTIKAQLDEGEELERLHSRPLWRARLTLPRPAALAIAVTAMEVRRGVRSPWHLERVSHYSMWPHWDTFPSPPARPHLAGTAARPLAVHLQEHTPGLVHATLVLEFAGTVEPLGLCLDGARGHWELMALEYPSATPPAIPPPSRDLPSERSTRSNDPFRRTRSLDHALGIPLGPPQRFQPHDPAWQRQLPDTPGIDLE
jgi:hypothetical protein